MDLMVGFFIRRRFEISNPPLLWCFPLREESASAVLVSIQLSALIRTFPWASSRTQLSYLYATSFVEYSKLYIIRFVSVENEIKYEVAADGECLKSK
jgi:hypothetical protein